jgi:hypothetical protein
LGENRRDRVLARSEVAEAVIAFSHSAIHRENDPNVDLRPLAFTLARAGGAVIVPERELVWPPKEWTMNRDGAAALICAAEWLASRTKIPNEGLPLTNKDNDVTRWFYAYLGPRLCASEADSRCRDIVPLSPPHHYYAWVPVGETEGEDKTDRIIADQGLSTAKWLQKHLGLHSITGIEHPAGT